MTILYNFASRSRTKAFFETLDNIAALSNSSDYFICAKLDNDDPKINEYRSRLLDYPKVIVQPGVSRSKINAINRNIPTTDWQILVNVSDDQRFLMKGFDDIIREHIEQDCFLHFPDSFKGKDLCTMSIMDRVYFNRTGYIFNPVYYSLWADNEETERSKILGCYKFVDIPIFDHLHYSNGKAVKDALYKRNDTYKKDQVTFNQRKEINFGL